MNNINQTYERKINYYETDGMGIVHHSNYIRYLEEARCFLLDNYNMSYSTFEKNRISIPVLAVNCKYKHHVTYGNTLLITPFVKEYNGVRMTVEYDVRDKETGDIVIIAETQHCFTNDLKAINLKKYLPDFDKKFTELKENKPLS